MYLIPEEIAKKYEHFLKEAHNLYIGQNEENNGLRFLNNALCGESTHNWDDGDIFNQYRGIFSKYAVDMNSPITGENITSVYISGYMM